MREIPVAMLFALGVGLVPAAIALAPRAASPVAIIAAPWAAEGEAARIVAAADGSIMATAHGGRIVIARFGAEGFVPQLYRSGALFVIDAAAVIACFTLSTTRASL